MKRLAIDTNALISFVTDRNPAQQEIIARRFQHAADLKSEIILIENVVTEFVYVLDTVYGIEHKRLRDMLESLMDTPGVAVKSWFDLSEVLELWPAAIGDYGDAILAAYARSAGIPVFSFDKDFRKQLKKQGIPVET